MKRKLLNVSLISILMIIVIVTIILRINNLEIRPAVAVFSVLVIMDILFLLCFLQSKKVKYFLVFSLAVIITILTPNYMSTVEDEVIINNIKLVRVKSISIFNREYDYYEYKNSFLMSHDLWMEKTNLSSDYLENENSSTYYYNDKLKENNVKE